ncbi:MAG TPA: beta-propeller fold lactonase family protein [Polyangiales bacterium]|nr:beta-propeller fold lactonase family protein [Polyangiales bacterium]
MNVRLSWISLSLALAACNSSSGREPADERDAATNTRDASIDAARDGATMDSSSGGDANLSRDAQSDSGGTDAGDASQPVAASDSFVYVGGWGNGDYPFKTFAFSGATGALTPVNTSTAFGVQPSFIAANQAGTLLYLTNEDRSAPGITIATLDATSGIPTKLDKRSDPDGGGFVHAAISPDGKTLLAADYEKGRLVSFPITNDEKLGAAASTIQFGASANTHSSAFSPDGSYAWAPNKGLDVIGQLSVNKATSQVTKGANLSTAGDGPRMIAVASSGQFAYVMFENDSSVEAYSITNGLLKQIDREDTLPEDFEDENTGAHALLHPNQKFLYVSNRGADQIVVFTVESDGKITLLDRTPSGGKTPRGFAIDASGRWLIAANQNENNLVTFAIGNDGKLTQTGTPVTGVQQPTTVAIVTKR